MKGTFDEQVTAGQPHAHCLQFWYHPRHIELGLEGRSYQKQIVPDRDM